VRGSENKASRIPARLSLLQAAGAVIALEPYFMRVASQVRTDSPVEEHPPD